MIKNKSIHLVECPRDAMQGWAHPISTANKIAYLQALLAVGFHTLDCGSFVSPAAIPQMADTKLVLPQLVLDNTTTKLLAIVANVRGAQDAVAFEQLTYLGFPFSISPTFQQRNTNSTMQQSLARVQAMQSLCVQHNKQLVVYISMGFGNPYGDAYSEDLVLQWVNEIASLGIKTISIADTVGLATPTLVTSVMQALVPAYPQIALGVHLHSAAHSWEPKLQAALQAGCTRFDGALKGIGGCPMANDELVGNMDTERMIPYFEQRGLLPGLNHQALAKASAMATRIFI